MINVNQHIIIEQCMQRGPQRFFDLQVPVFPDKHWRKNVMAYESFKKREQIRTTSNMEWRKSGGGLWYYCAWADDYLNNQQSFEKVFGRAKRKLVEIEPGQIRITNSACELIVCNSMAEFFSYIDWDHPNKRFIPTAKVYAWDRNGPHSDDLPDPGDGGTSGAPATPAPAP